MHCPPPEECKSQLLKIRPRTEFQVVENEAGHLYVALNGISLEINYLLKGAVSLTMVTTRPQGRYHVLLWESLDGTWVKHYYAKKWGAGYNYKKWGENFFSNRWEAESGSDKWIEKKTAFEVARKDNGLVPDVAQPTIQGMDAVWIAYCQWFVARNGKNLINSSQTGFGGRFLDWGIQYFENQELLSWQSIVLLLGSPHVAVEFPPRDNYGNYDTKLTVTFNREMENFTIPKFTNVKLKLCSSVPQPQLTIKLDADTHWEEIDWQQDICFTADSNVVIEMPKTAPFPFVNDRCLLRTDSGIAALDYSRSAKSKWRDYRKLTKNYLDLTWLVSNVNTYGKQYGNGTEIILPPQ